MRKRNPQEYTPAEFDAVVAMIRADKELQADIEAITGQSIEGKTPREIFDLFRTIQKAAEVQAAVVNYGRARAAVRATRAQLEADAEAEQALQLARSQIKALETRNEALKRENSSLHVRLGNATAMPARAVYGEATGHRPLTPPHPNPRKRS